MAKEQKTLGVTFKGPVTFNGPMFDIHDNKYVKVVNSGGEKKERPTGRSLTSDNKHDLLIVAAEQREAVLEVIRSFVSEKKGKDTIITFKAAKNLELIADIPPVAIAESQFGYSGGKSNYDDYKNGRRTILAEEVEAREKQLKTAIG